MPENNTCVCCGRMIPEGTMICLQCGCYDDIQTFKVESAVKDAEAKEKRIKKMMDSKITDFVWSYVCKRKEACSGHTCAECVMDALERMQQGAKL